MWQRPVNLTLLFVVSWSTLKTNERTTTPLFTLNALYCLPCMNCDHNTLGKEALNFVRISMNTKLEWKKWENLWLLELAENSRCQQSINLRLQIMLRRWTMWLNGIGQRSLARSKTDSRDGNRSHRDQEEKGSHNEPGRGAIFSFHMYMMNCYLKNPQREGKQLVKKLALRYF